MSLPASGLLPALFLAAAGFALAGLLFRLIFEQAPVGVARRRADPGRGRHGNPTLCRILERSDAEAPDAVLFVELTRREDLPAQREQERRIESGESDSYTLEKRFVLKDGRLVWGRLSVAVVRNETGHIVQEIAILEDISERKRTEPELAGTLRQSRAGRHTQRSNADARVKTAAGKPIARFNW